MNVERIREKLINGFRPFTICTTAGRAFPVPHPKYIAIGEGVVVVIGKDDRVNTLDPLHISSVTEKSSHK